MLIDEKAKIGTEQIAQLNEKWIFFLLIKWVYSTYEKTDVA